MLKTFDYTIIIKYKVCVLIILILTILLQTITARLTLSDRLCETPKKAGSVYVSRDNIDIDLGTPK